MATNFAFITPNRLLSTDFKQIEANKFVYNLENPAEIREFTIALLNLDIPKNHGIAAYYSLPPYNEWQYLGALTIHCPTIAFRAPWYEQISFNVPMVQIGLALESYDTLKTMQPSDQKEEEKSSEIAKGIAENLYNFMSSYSTDVDLQTVNLNEKLILPTNCVDLWFKKFSAKHRRNPYFWMKKIKKKKKKNQ